MLVLRKSSVDKFHKLLRSSWRLASTTVKPAYINFPGKHPLIYRTIGQQLDIAANSFGDNEVIVSSHENIRLTYAELKDKSDRLAASLIGLGMQPGDRLGIWAPNTSYWVVAMIAAARAGLITVGLNPAYQIPEVKFCLNKVGVKGLLAAESFKTQNYYEMLRNIIPELDKCSPDKLESGQVPCLKSIIIASDKRLPGTYQLKELMKLPSDAQIRNVQTFQSSIQPDDCCSIQFTSGTTGEPKASMLSHFNYINNSFNISIRNELHLKHHRALIQMPFFHAFASVIILLSGMHHGTTHICESLSFKAAQSVKAIVNEECSFIYGTPTMYVDLIKECRENHLKFDKLEIGVTGGAACSPKLFNDIKSVLGLRRINSVFGLTEISAVGFQSFPDDSKEKVLETVGHIQDHLEAKVIDENGKTVPFGEPGELCIRGYSTMLGYWDEPEKTKEALDETKWFHTGDKFALDENGYGRIVGRIKEMIIRGGENIAPKEIEDFLNTHPDILESYVVGIPDERLGEEVCAFVRLSKGNLTLDDIKSYCKGRISHYKIPKHLKICESFPKTTSGKVQKYKLRESFQV